MEAVFLRRGIKELLLLSKESETDLHGSAIGHEQKLLVIWCSRQVRFDRLACGPSVSITQLSLGISAMLHFQCRHRIKLQRVATSMVAAHFCHQTSPSFIASSQLDFSGTTLVVIWPLDLDVAEKEKKSVLTHMAVGSAQSTPCHYTPIS